MRDPTTQIDSNKQSFRRDFGNVKVNEMFEAISSYLADASTIVDASTAVPENIVEFSQKGFTVDLNAMMPEKRYRFRYDGSRYEIWRNADDALELLELEPWDD